MQDIRKPHYDSTVARGLLRGTLDRGWDMDKKRAVAAMVAGYK